MSTIGLVLLILAVLVFLAIVAEIFIIAKAIGCYFDLPTKDKTKVRHFGKMVLRFLANRLKRKERYRETVEDIEKVLETERQ